MKRFALLALAASVFFVSPASASPHHSSGHAQGCRLLGIAHTYALPDAETGGGELLIYVYRCTDGTTHEKTVRVH